MEQQLRQTAYKVWISDLINKQVQKEEGEWSPSYIIVDNKRVSRVNIIANVVMKYKAEDGGYSTLTVDDSSSDIQIKAWKEDISLMEDIEIGETVLLIGKVREYNSQVYIVPEIIKPLDSSEWVELRKKELSRLYGEREVKVQETPKPEEKKEESSPQDEVKVEEVSMSGNSDRQKILNIIENLDKNEGSDLMEVIQESKLDEEAANTLIQELLKEGEIFEIKPGKLKIIE
jgi:RPA family protein